MDHKTTVARPSRAADARVIKSRLALRGALIALAGEKPFADLTAIEIAARAGVGYATFFRHFASKEALLADVAEALILDMVGHMSPLLSATESGAAALALARFVDERRPICGALLVGAGDAVRRELTERATRLALGRTVIAPSLPPELVVAHSVGATLNILSWWLGNGADVPVERMAEILDRLVLAPLARM